MSSPSSSSDSKSSVNGTASTKNSSELIRTLDKLTLNDPFVNQSSHSVSNNAAGTLPGPVVQFRSLEQQIALDDLRHRQIGGSEFGSARTGEPLTQFVLVDDVQCIADYRPDGPLGCVMNLKSMWDFCVDPKHDHPNKGHFKVLLRYADSSDVEVAIAILRGASLNVMCISAIRFCHIYYDLNGGQLPNGHCLSKCGPKAPTLALLGDTFRGGYDGQILVQAHSFFGLADSPAELQDLAFDAMQSLFFEVEKSFAHPKIVDAVSTPSAPQVVQFVVELYEHKVADYLVDWFKHFANGFSYKGFAFQVTHYRPGVLDGPTGYSHLALRRRFILPKTQDLDLDLGFAGNVVKQVMPQRVAPIRGARYPTFDRVGYTYDSRIHNTVKWDAVVNGEDTRTTFMLRNIPSDLNYVGLKKFIDTFIKYLYDFLYLRVDFATKKNLGYAFINVGKPQDILPFLKACVGLRWPVRGNSKRVEVSYATVQNIETLINKFRNSAVMLEPDPNSKPHLYYLEHEDPLRAGQERPFPGPDNQQKQMRSEQNAANYGLYTHGHTRRPGKFDRGHPNDYFRNVTGHYEGNRVVRRTGRQYEQFYY